MGLSDIFNIDNIKRENESLKQQIAFLQNRIDSLGIKDVEEARKAVSDINAAILSNSSMLETLKADVIKFTEESNKKEKQLISATNKIKKNQELYKSMEYCIKNFFNSDIPFLNTLLADTDSYELGLHPSVTLKLNCMNIADLRKAFRENDKRIETLLEQYSARYTTKANKTIYSLMVIALRAELQNILVELKYEKLDKAIETLKIVTYKYLAIAEEGNQNMSVTLVKFIGELEYLFSNAIKIEYNYYVKKEQARQEQLAIREQMRQEAEERKALEVEKKKIEQEEAKFSAEINKLNETLENTSDNEEIAKLKARLLELEIQLSDVVIKKDDILNLQNGKAGTVYIISNLGSFGDNMFKVGMTRRLDPQDRVNELGDASVPFKFDVHSFIFSDDAVTLEAKMHQILNDKRVNKVNRRKEFFNTTIDELEKIALELEPTIEFNRTMVAEEFYQSQSTEVVYTDDFIDDEAETDNE